jgi:hypothetical protein
MGEEVITRDEVIEIFGALADIKGCGRPYPLALGGR